MDARLQQALKELLPNNRFLAEAFVDALVKKQREAKNGSITCELHFSAGEFQTGKLGALQVLRPPKEAVSNRQTLRTFRSS